MAETGVYTVSRNSYGRRFLQKAQQYATPRTMLIAMLVFGPILALCFTSQPYREFMRLSNERGLTPPDMQFVATPTQTYAYLDGMGTDGREAYAQWLLIDMFTPLLLSSTLFLVLAYLSKHLLRPGHPLSWLMILPLLSLPGEWIENLGLRWMLSAYPIQLPLVATVTPAFTLLKLGSTFVAMPIALIGGAVLFISRFRQKRNLGNIFKNSQ